LVKQKFKKRGNVKKSNRCSKGAPLEKPFRKRKREVETGKSV